MQALKGHEKLQVLNLSNNIIGDAGVGSLSSLLQSPNSITDLDLSANGIGVIGAARGLNRAWATRTDV